MIKAGLIILTLLCSVARPLSASETATIYQVAREHVIPGYSAYYVSKGINIGKMLPIKLPQNEKLTPGQPFQETLAILKAGEGYKENLIHQGQVATSESLAKEAAEPRLAPLFTATGDNRPATPLPTSTLSYDAELFRDCAKRSLPILKRLQSAKEHRENEIANLLEDQLRPEKADGENLSPVGMTCGKFLGHAGMVSLRWQDEVKLLSAVQVRSGKETEQLIETFVASHHPLAPVENLNTWAFIWNRLSLAAVFSKDALPSYEDLVAVANNTPEKVESKKTDETGVLQIQLSVRLENSERSLSLGLEFARRRLK